MIDQILNSDDFTKSLKGGADLRMSLSDLLSGIPQPILSSHERYLLESTVILRPLSSVAPSTDEMLHRRLIILANDLTDPDELARLRRVAEEIQETRRRRMRSEPRRGFVPSLYVLGAGAEYSESFPYRSPQAQEIRDSLAALGVLFFERPTGMDADQLRTHMEGLLGRR